MWLCIVASDILWCGVRGVLFVGLDLGRGRLAKHSYQSTGLSTHNLMFNILIQISNSSCPMGHC